MSQRDRQMNPSGATIDSDAVDDLAVLESNGWPLLCEAAAASVPADAAALDDEARTRMWRNVAARLHAQASPATGAAHADVGDATLQNVRRESGGWRHLSPLAEFKVLYRDEHTLSWLLRLAPGGTVPSHGHGAGVEECLVLEGEVLLNGERFRSGDYQAALPGSRHDQVQGTNAGCLVFLRSPASRYRQLAVLAGIEEGVAGPIREVAQGLRRWWDKRDAGRGD